LAKKGDDNISVPAVLARFTAIIAQLLFVAIAIAALTANFAMGTQSFHGRLLFTSSSAFRLFASISKLFYHYLGNAPAPGIDFI
jgi:hypothetical protein